MKVKRTKKKENLKNKKKKINNYLIKIKLN